MVVPKVHDITLPLLKFASDGKMHSVNEAAEKLSEEFNLTDEERTKLKPSGGETQFMNRLRFARLHLRLALLIEDPKKAHIRITERGLDALKQNPSAITEKFLSQYPEYVKTRRKENNVEDLIKEHDKNRNFSKQVPDKVRTGEQERENFVNKFPSDKILEIPLEKYVAGKRPLDKETFSYLLEYGSLAYGNVKGGSAMKFSIFVRVETQEYEFHKPDIYKSKEEAYESIINKINELVNVAKNFDPDDGDWKKFGLVMEDEDNPLNIAVRAKLIKMYFPEKFFKLWSHKWMNATLDLFGVPRDDLDDDADFYAKHGRLWAHKQSHPIMKEWTSDFFSDLLKENLLFNENPNTNLVTEKKSSDVDMENKKYARHVKILQRKKNIILYGPPGTGKTFAAKEIAKLMIGNNENATLKNVLEIPSLPDKNSWFEFLKSEIKKLNPNFVVDTPEGEYKFGITTDKEEIRLWASYANVSSDSDRVEVGIKTNGIEWLNGVDSKNAYVLIVNISKNCFVVVPYDILKAEGRFRGGQHWDETGTENMWFTLPELNKNNASLLVRDNSSSSLRLEIGLNNFCHLLPKSEIKNPSIVTFHQSYGYEEFVQGIRPQAKGDVITYPILPGIFKKICDEARNSKEPFVLIIDEINRGNISKIFGELITVIENDKRDDEVLLAYSGKPFSVPEKVYLIGTMNTADQSLTHIDAALKRRFSSIEVAPDSSVVKDGLTGLSELLDAINERISDKRTRDELIGHSYFMHKGKAIADVEELQLVFATEIIPLLRDYFYDSDDDLKEVLGGQFIDWEGPAMDVKEDWQNDVDSFKAEIRKAYNIEI